MIDNLSKNIRELCNHPWKKELLFQDRVKWSKLWTSLDVIEDSQQAINDYLSLPEFNSNSRGYLYIYGVLQGINLQQDALKNLSGALFNEKIDFKENYPKLYKIREYRNDSIGHPTNRGNGKSFHYIGRPSIKKSGFKLISYYPKTGEQTKIEDINILECIEIQKTLIAEKLNEVMKNLENDFKNHKEKFKDNNLSDLIHNSFHYEFSKLYENLHRDYELTEMNFDIIEEAYIKIKEGIIERYTSLSALSGIEFITERLDYLFKRLRKDFIENKIKDQLELEFFIDALKHNFKELEQMTKEVDEEFK